MQSTLSFTQQKEPRMPLRQKGLPVQVIGTPVAALCWNGHYHLFSQSAGGDWEHAVSPDLFTWLRLPTALPSISGECLGGGCVVNNEGTPTILYRTNEGLRLAFSHDGMLTWHRYPELLRVSPPPLYFSSHEFSAPTVWREGMVWYMAMGCAVVGERPAVLLYQSHNLLSWEYVSPLYVGKDRDSYVWERVSFFSVGGKWVLLASSLKQVQAQYFVGHWQDFRFLPEQQGVLAFGESSPLLTFLDVVGRRILLSSVNNAVALPRVISVGKECALQVTPHPDLKTLRRPLSCVQTTPSGSNTLKGASLPECFEALLLFGKGNAKRVGLEFHQTGEGNGLRVTYDVSKRELYFEQGKRAVLLGEGTGVRFSGFLALRPYEPHQFQAIFAQGTLDLYVNQQFCFSASVPLAIGFPFEIVPLVEGGGVQATQTEVWELQPTECVTYLP